MTGSRPPAPDPAWDWRIAPRPGDTDAATARAAPPDAVERIAAAQRSPRDWRSLLDPEARGDDP